MTYVELRTDLILKARSMRLDGRNIMLSPMHAWGRTINQKRFKPFFTIGSKKCLTLEEAKALKGLFYDNYSGLRRM